MAALGKEVRLVAVATEGEMAQEAAIEKEIECASLHASFKLMANVIKLVVIGEHAFFKNPIAKEQRDLDPPGMHLHNAGSNKRKYGSTLRCTNRLTSSSANVMEKTA